jgi:FtsH-binding integral membrane protein
VLINVYDFLLKGSQDFSISPVPSASATLSAVSMGLIIPVVSSILPIMQAMNKNLGDSLSASRSMTKGVKVAIEEQNSFASKTPYLLFGLLASFSGIAIYYLLPLSIINLNLGLMLSVFFGILLGMILGLTLIATNFQRILELFFTYTLLFFETRSMKHLIVKNLTAHRESNKMTSIIFSLTLGCIIFVVVASNL